jgi:MSHA biogenesis protein MshM
MGMYESFFGLREAPFSLTPSTHFFVQSDSHAEALEMLLVGLQNNEGFMKVTGEVGTGKTLTCRMLLNALQDKAVTAYIPNPSCSPETLYCLVADELSVAVTLPDDNPLSHHIDSYFQAQRSTTEVHIKALQNIQERLLKLAAEGKPVVLVIDEAQAMPHETIEALRLISNLETESRKLIQIVLFGQPELDTMLSQPGLRQLAQRISFQYHLQPLSPSAITSYVQHRLSQAGISNGSVFSSSALRVLARASQGIPRLINLLCHKSLLLSYGQGSPYVGRLQMLAAIGDTPSAQKIKFPFWQRPISGLVLPVCISVFIAGVWLLQYTGVTL